MRSFSQYATSFYCKFFLLIDYFGSQQLFGKIATNGRTLAVFGFCLVGSSKFRQFHIKSTKNKTCVTIGTRTKAGLFISAPEHDVNTSALSWWVISQVTQYYAVCVQIYSANFKHYLKPRHISPMLDNLKKY